MTIFLGSSVTFQGWAPSRTWLALIFLLWREDRQDFLHIISVFHQLTAGWAPAKLSLARGGNNRTFCSICLWDSTLVWRNKQIEFIQKGAISLFTTNLRVWLPYKSPWPSGEHSVAALGLYSHEILDWCTAFHWDTPWVSETSKFTFCLNLM